MEEKKVSIILFKNWKFILFSMLFIGVMALVISFVTPKKYRAYATLYPPNSNSMEAVLAKPEFGYEIHADRMMQLFDSERVRKAVIEKFDLINYYELDSTKSGWRSDLIKNYTNDIEYSRSKYLSVSIVVTTKDPKLSADIANFLVEFIDVVREGVFLDNMLLAKKEYENQYKESNYVTDSLLQVIYSFSSTNSNELKKDTPIFKLRNDQILEKRKKGNISSADNAILSIPGQNQSGEVDKLINEYYFQNQGLNEIKSKLKTINDKIRTPMPKSYVISTAQPDESKVSPSILMNVLLGLGVGLLLGVIITLFRSKFEAIKRELS